MGVGRQGIPGCAAVELAEFQQPEDTLRNLPLHFHGSGVKFRAGHKGINTLGSLGNVGGLAVNIQRHFAGPGHQFLSAAEHHALFQSRPQMQTEDGFDLAGFQHAGIADGFGTARTFLTGLENQQNIVV